MPGWGFWSNAQTQPKSAHCQQAAQGTVPNQASRPAALRLTTEPDPHKQRRALQVKGQINQISQTRTSFPSTLRGLEYPVFSIDFANLTCAVSGNRFADLGDGKSQSRPRQSLPPCADRQTRNLKASKQEAHDNRLPTASGRFSPLNTGNFPVQERPLRFHGPSSTSWYHARSPITARTFA